MSVTVDTTAARVLEVARAELGQHEDPFGSNRTKYGKWYGMNGVAWCNQFVTWVLHHAGAEEIPKFAYTPASEQWFRDHGAWKGRDYTPKPGDLVWFNFPGDGVNRTSHIGIIEGNLADGRRATIEGNTNGAGGRTGGMVMRHNRSVAGGIVGYGVITYQGGAPEPTPQEDDDVIVIYKVDKGAGPDGDKTFAVHGNKRRLCGNNGQDYASLKARGFREIQADAYTWQIVLDTTSLAPMGSGKPG